MIYLRRVRLERWRPVPTRGYSDYYEVSNWGRVRSLRTGKVLKPLPNGDGYVWVDLRVAGKRKGVKIHHLVLLAFVGPRPTPKHEANHENGKRDYNADWNLEWVTRKENCTHRNRVLGFKGANFGNRGKPEAFGSKDYIVLSPQGDSVTVRNLKQFCIQNGLHHSLMYAIAKGHRKTHRGWSCQLDGG